MSMGNHGGMISAGKNSWFVHQISLAILKAQPSSSKVGWHDEGNYEIYLSKYCNVLGVLYSRWNFIALQNQYTTVKHSRKLFEHTYTSDLYGLGTPTPIEFFRQDLLWRSSNTHSHSCSQKASKHTRSIRRRAIGPLAHHNGTSAYSPSLTCTSPDDRMSSSSTV
jgi:hypothetical protein